MTEPKSASRQCVCGHVDAQHDQRRSIPQGFMADWRVVWGCGWTGCGCQRFVAAEVPVTTDLSASASPSPHCTSTALVTLIGRVRCDKPVDHEGWHRWQIEWQDAGGHIDARAQNVDSAMQPGADQT